MQIIEYISQTVESLGFNAPSNIDEVIDIDKQTREYIEKLIAELSLNK